VDSPRSDWRVVGNLWREKLVEHMKYRGLVELINGVEEASPFKRHSSGLLGYTIGGPTTWGYHPTSAKL
jgi:hypothetical protein